MDRFEAFLFLRAALRERRLVRRGLGVEALMEGLADRLGQPAGAWGVLGLVSEVDAALTAHNPARRGLLAAEMLQGHGLPPEGLEALRTQWRAGLDAPLLTRALAAAVPACRLLLEGAGQRGELEALGPTSFSELLEDGSIAPEASRTRIALLAPEGLAPPALLCLARERLLEIADDLFPRAPAPAP